MEFQELIKSNGDLFASRYKLLRVLGRGGMGSVYLVEDTLLEQKIALKVLHLKLVDDKRASKRFLREVQLARLVTHPSVVRTFDAGKFNGLLFLTMEYVKGHTLDQIFQHSPASLDEAMCVLHEVCLGLQVIHEAGVLHRDLKPANIILSTEGMLKITDFGIATRELTYGHPYGDGLGSAGYMAPEVFMTEETSPATDIYSLGALAYFLFCGTPPCQGDSLDEILNKQARGKFPEPKSIREDMPSWLNLLVMSMLAKDPAYRPQSASEVLEEIDLWYDNKDHLPLDADGEYESSLDDEMGELFSCFVEQVNISLIEKGEEQVAEPEEQETATEDHRETPNSVPEQIQAPWSKWKLLKTVLGRGILASALLIGLLAGSVSFFGESIIHVWAGVSSAEDLLPRVGPGILVVAFYCLIGALPLVAVRFLYSGRKGLLGAFFKSCLASCVIFFLTVSLLVWKAGEAAWTMGSEEDVKATQWVVEAAVQRFVESMMLMPRGTIFEAPDESDALLSQPGYYDPVLHFERATSFSSGTADGGVWNQPQLQLPVVELFSENLTDYLPFIMLTLLYALSMLLIVGSGLRAQYKFRLRRVIAVASCAIMALLIVECLAEASVLESGPAILADEVELRIGPFYQITYGYSLLCGALNWLLLGSGFFAPILFRARKVSKSK